ncbi:hypothetical protein WG909_13040 [Peptostreptococcaceae bacterium AGR-M142]
MLNLESSVKDVISKKLEDGTIEMLIEKELEKGIQNALNSLFGRYGEVSEMLEKKIKEIMNPIIENMDFKDHIVKLDSLATQIVKESTFDNNKILENFKTLVSVEDIDKKEYEITEIFEKWCEYASKEVDTDKLDIEDHESYKNIHVSYEFNKDKNSHRTMKYASINFKCEEDEDLDFSFNLYTFSNNDYYSIESNYFYNIPSLRHLNEFQILLLKLAQNNVKIHIDSEYETLDVEVEAEPEY